MYDQQCCMEVKHGSWERLRFYEGKKDLWWELICGLQLKDRKISMDWMLMLGLNETMDQLALANSVCWYGHVLRREDGHVLRRALIFEVGGQRKIERPKRTWKKQIKEESLRREDALSLSKWSVGVNQIAAGLRWIWPPSLVEDTIILWISVSPHSESVFLSFNYFNVDHNAIYLLSTPMEFVCCFIL